MLADGVSGLSYTDTTWYAIPNGTYQFGISTVSADGIESEILWSNSLVKTDYGIQENTSSEKRIQKIIENGNLFILVNGKKYSVTGQEVR